MAVYRRRLIGLNIVVLGCAAALTTCRPESNSGTAGTARHMPGFDDIEKIRFHFGRTETTNSFNPEKATIEDELEPVSSDEIQALFSTITAPLFRNVHASDVTKIEDLKAFLPAIGDELRKSMLKVVTEVQSRLPNKTPYVINYGLIPYKQREVMFADDGYSYTGTRSESNSMRRPDNFFQMISDNMKKVQEEGYKRRTSGFQNYFLGSIMRVSLLKGDSKALFQIALGLNPRTIPMEPPPSPVIELKKIVIPDNGKAELSTVMLVNIGMSLVKDEPPQIKVRFGALKGLVENELSEAEIQVQDLIAPSLSLSGAFQAVACNNSHKAQPYLVGDIKKEAIPTKSNAIIDFFKRLGDKKITVDFHFQDIDLDAQKGAVKSIELGIAGGLQLAGLRYTAGCLNVGQVEDQFKTEINNEISAQIAKLKSDAANVLKTLSGGK